MPSLSPLSESSGSLTAHTEGSKSLTVASVATETLSALREEEYAWQYLFPGTIYPAQSLTGGNIYPGLYGDRTGLTLTVGVEGTKTLTPLTEV